MRAYRREHNSYGLLPQFEVVTLATSTEHNTYIFFSTARWS